MSGVVEISRVEHVLHVLGGQQLLELELDLPFLFFFASWFIIHSSLIMAQDEIFLWLSRWRNLRHCLPLVSLPGNRCFCNFNLYFFRLLER